MKKDVTYLLTFLSVLGVSYLLGYISYQLTIKASIKLLVEFQLESSRREAREISKLIDSQLESGISEITVINNLQKSIENSNMDAGFICMFDTNGFEICHPNINRIGQQVLPNESSVQTVGTETDRAEFTQILKNKKEIGGIRNFSTDRNSEIIYTVPLENKDWIIAAHANYKKVTDEIEELKNIFLLVNGFSGITISLLSFVFIRSFTGRQERKLERENDQLSKELLNITKLNNDLISYKNKVSSTLESSKDSDKETKSRLLVYYRNELLPVQIKNIAFIYTENSIIYIKCLNGTLGTATTSLDELSKTLDQAMFFRANRQTIISINSISKIIKYGNHQLKIITLLESEKEIYINKNKVSEFKSWLNS